MPIFNTGEGGFLKYANVGFKYAIKHNYDVVGLPDDCKWDPTQIGWLKKIQELAYSDSNIAAVNTRISNKTLHKLDHTKIEVPVGYDLSYKKHSTLLKYGLIDENYRTCGDEIDFALQVYFAKQKLVSFNLNGYVNFGNEATQRRSYGVETINRFQKEAIIYRNKKWGFLDEN